MQESKQEVSKVPSTVQKKKKAENLPGLSCSKLTMSLVNILLNFDHHFIKYGI